jgi:endo-1,3(4)-beta-glucanase
MEHVEDDDQQQYRDTISAYGDAGASLSAALPSYGTLSFSEGSTTDAGDTFDEDGDLSPRRRSERGRNLPISPLMGESLVGMDADEDEALNAMLLSEGPAPRLNLPPLARNSRLSSYQRGGVKAVSLPHFGSPSSVNAQPGDWQSVGVKYAGATGTTNTDAARPSMWTLSSLHRGDRNTRSFSTGLRIFAIVLALSLTGLLAVAISNWMEGDGSVLPGGGQGSSNSGTSTTRSATSVPFPYVNRAKFGDSAEKIVDPDLFDQRLLGETSAASGSTDSDDVSDEEIPEDNDIHVRRQRRQQKTDSRNDPPIQPFLKVPFPTGAFWTNLVLKPTSDQGLSYPIFSYPYGYKWSASKLVTSYPPLRRKMDETSIRDEFNPDLSFGSAETITKRSVVAFDPLSVTVRFLTNKSKNRSAYWESYIVRGSPYITVKYKSSTPEITPLSIFKSIQCPRDGEGNYKDSTIRAKGNDENSEGQRNLESTWGVCSSTADTPGSDVTLSGVQFLLQTQENLTWMVFASSPIVFLLDGAESRTIKATRPFSGVLRFALIPPPTSGNDSGFSKSQKPGSGSDIQLSSSSGVRRLIYHAPFYPVGGSITWEFEKDSSFSESKVGQTITGFVGGVSGNITSILSSPTNSSASISYQGEKVSSMRSAKISFKFQALSMSDTVQQPPIRAQLLMLALPHHVVPMDGTMFLKGDQFDLQYNCIKGRMTPILGDTWEYEEQLPSIGFDEMNTTTKISSMHNGVRDTILEQATKDMVRVLPTFDENVYGFGKQAARLAQIVHISHMLSFPTRRNKKESDKEVRADVIEGGLDSLRKFVCTFLRNGQKDKLMFDAKFGSIVTKDGLDDVEADFGNGRMNDHHFHYGYLLYACAILGKYDPNFVSEYGVYVDALLYDVAYNSNPDSASSDGGFFFPFARHINWYDGHSFASGLFPYGNGKSQESSSEAVNCYYGAYLWSKIRWGDDGSPDSDDKGGTNFARLLLAMEMRGAETYWHMVPKPTNSSSTAAVIYDNKFASNYMVGNLGMSDIVCSTWFGTNKLYVHMINFLPLTAVTSLLFDSEYVKDEFESAIEPIYSDVEMAWKGYVVGDRSIIDPNNAWDDAINLISYELDSALSLSQLLYFISLRKNFNPSFVTTAISDLAPGTAKVGEMPSSSSACQLHSACVDLGLMGECCPTSNGNMLECCQSNSSAGTGYESGNDPSNSTTAACESHPLCTNLGLVGDCCPSKHGSFLGCCGN